MNDQIENVVIYEAQTGQGALAQLYKHTTGFNLVLLELELADSSGFDLLDRIRAAPTQQYTPIVLFSTNDTPRQVNKAYDKGANAYMVKPLDADGYTVLAKVLATCFLGNRRSDRMSIFH